MHKRSPLLFIVTQGVFLLPPTMDLLLLLLLLLLLRLGFRFGLLLLYALLLVLLLLASCPEDPSGTLDLPSTYAFA